MQINPLLLIDGYKADHRRQYPEGTTMVYSNWTPRKSRLEGVDRVVFFGLQYFLRKYLQEGFDEGFFSRKKGEVCDEYKATMDAYLGKDSVPVDHIADLHDLGYLPLSIKAVEEGTFVDIGVPMLTVHNTLPEFFWLTNQIETLMSSVLWTPCTSATIANQFRREFQRRSHSDNYGGIKYQGHDFSFRGMSSPESAAISGAGHLTSFAGTDTVPAIKLIEKYYPGNAGLIGASVPATEHSVMCMGGQVDEIATYKRLLNGVYPSGIVSIVSDTWDFWSIMTTGLQALRDDIALRYNKTGGTVVFRPDCYDSQTEILTDTGWKLFPDLRETDRVAQVLPDNTYQFVVPEKVINQPYTGNMVRFYDEKGKVDLLVTPNHRMLWNTKGKDRVVEAEKSAVGYHYIKAYRGADAPDKSQILTPLERFKIAFQADGSYPSKISKTPISGYRSYRFTFTKQRKIERLVSICKAGDFRYSVSVEKARKGQNVVYVWLPVSVEVRKDFNWIDTATLCGSWCREFIQELSYWDATRRSDTRIKFDTTVKAVADKVALIGLAAGHGVHQSISVDARKAHFSDIHTCHIMQSNMIGGRAFQKSTENYAGTVHCVKVPSGMVLVRRNGATMVSGNSGDPVKIICGDPDAPEGSPEHKGAFQCLWDVFGGKQASGLSGLRQLHPAVGLIYGDSITQDRQRQILSGLMKKGFEPTVVLGIGSYTYQYTTRDTFGFAMKATYGEVNGEGREIFKSPKTDPTGEKKSAKGLLRVVQDVGMLRLEDQLSKADWLADSGLLKDVFANGAVVRTTTFDAIRNRLYPQGF